MFADNLLEMRKLHNWSQEELAERKANWKPNLKEVSGYLARYRELVTSGNRGAVLEIK